MKALVIARLTFREALRKRMIWGVALLSVCFAVVFYWGFIQVRNEFLNQVVSGDRPRGFGTFLSLDLVAGIIDGLGFYTINFLAGVMTIFAAVGTVAGEIESGTFQAIVTKPLARWEIILGKYLGFAAMIALYIVAMSADVALTSRAVTGYVPGQIVQGTALVILVSLILLALTMLGSAILPTMANGVVVFMLYGMALLGGLLEQMGSILAIHSLVVVGVVTSLILPSDVVWQLANTVLQPDIGLRLAGPIPIAVSRAPSAAMIYYAGAYVVVLVGLSVLAFQRRDL
ncbi:MAG TPA: ABC transporter permease subunit [Thermomicrobiales bacterium]|jgi:ABC-type transport system involved in multi-copper enzyme maturation permease subunit|nr:ABC transporter permease subunit [Thermomicrobiales bacterium]